MTDSTTDLSTDNITGNNTDFKHKNSGPSVSAHAIKRKYSCKFDSNWFSKADFSQWLGKIDNHTCREIFCQKSFTIKQDRIPSLRKQLLSC